VVSKKTRSTSVNKSRIGFNRGLNCDPEALDRWARGSSIDADEDVSMFWLAPRFTPGRRTPPSQE
jgi:hypothetical protein